MRIDIKDNDTYSYKGWLLSDKFWKRSLAVIGYFMVGYIIFFLIILALVFILSVI